MNSNHFGYGLHHSPPGVDLNNKRILRLKPDGRVSSNNPYGRGLYRPVFVWTKETPE